MNFRALFEHNKPLLRFYSPYNFDKNIDPKKLFEHLAEMLDKYIQNKDYEIIKVKEQEYIFIYKKLEWDTDYFKIPTYRLFNVLGMDNEHLKEAVLIFSEKIIPPGSYCFIEIPSEDIELIQALGESRFKLIETRLTYYNNQLTKHVYERFPVKQAKKNNIPNLKNVASKMRNNYDRFHADKTFDVKQADLFLSTYIENSVLGYADYVLIPDDPDLPSDSFLTANYLTDEWKRLDCKVSKMVLSAVSSETNKGWYIKLISEMTYHLRDNIGSECVFLNTQSTNRAVFNTWEKLGFKLGCTSHVFSITK